MKILNNFIFCTIIPFFVQCGANLPLIDADIPESNNRSITTDIQVPLNWDYFPQNDSFIENRFNPSGVVDRLWSVYGVPFQFNITFRPFARMELGFGGLYFYEKFLIKKTDPVADNFFSRIAVSQYFGAGGIIFGDHTYFHAGFDAGILYGYHFNENVSLNSGLLYEQGIWSASNSSKFTTFKTWGTCLKSDRKSIVLPFHITLNSKNGKRSYRFGCKFPFDISEKYMFHESYDDSLSDKSEDSRSIKFNNRVNVIFKASVSFNYCKERKKRVRRFSLFGFIKKCLLE